MEGGNFFEVFYSKFITRDFFAKIIPGSIVLLTISLLNIELRTMLFTSGEKVSFILGAFLFGICWMIGIGIQGSGNYVKTKLKEFKRDSSQVSYLHSVFDKEYREFQMSLDTEYAQGYVERKIVIQEASLIALYSVITSGIMILLNLFSFYVSLTFLVFQLLIGYGHMYKENMEVAKLLVKTWNDLDEERKRTI